MTHRGFTIIELLVVITIIVVLLALLTPALDKAIYQAELAVCGTTLRTMGTTSVIYATDHKRRYPRTSPQRGTQRTLKQTVDMRPLVDDYMSINDVFNDPLTETGDFESLQYDSTWCWIPTRWYAGYGPLGFREMNKIGDKIGFEKETSTGKVPISFDIIASDALFRFDSAGNLASSHPDSNGLLSDETVHESRGKDDEATAAEAGVISRVTMPLWIGNIGLTSQDMNFAYQDGSVRRIDDILMGRSDLTGDEASDERMVRFPFGYDPVYDLREHMPAN